MDLVVIGGGASATLLLGALARAGGLRAAGGGRGRIVVVDPAEEPGPGVPYRTPEPWHRMNVRARELSADTSDPEHFVSWLAASEHPEWLGVTGVGGFDASSAGADGATPGALDFVPRRVFGRYLSEVWNDATAPEAGHDVIHLRSRAVAVRRSGGGGGVAGRGGAGAGGGGAGAGGGGGGAVVTLESGECIDARHVVLATGLPPTGPSRFAVDPEVPTGVVIGDPWSSGGLDRVGPPTGVPEEVELPSGVIEGVEASAKVPEGVEAPLGPPGAGRAVPGAGQAVMGAGRAVLVGTGLTAVDVALTLAGLGWNVTAVSPVGSFPARHVDEPRPAQLPLPPPPDPPTASAVTGWVRAACRDEPEGWQSALDLVRHQITGVWTQMGWDDRRRLARHAGALWQSHRHRVAPEVADRLAGLLASGRVAIERGWVRAVEGAASGAVVVVTDRRHGDLATASRLAADLVVNCAGPPGVADVDDPLVASLLADGAARVDPLGLGLEVTDDGALVAADGAPVPGLWLIGALRRGTQLESTAVPDLRVHATRLAECLLADAAQRVSTSAAAD